MTPDEAAGTRALAERLVTLETELERCASVLEVATEVLTIFGSPVRLPCLESAVRARSILNPTVKEGADEAV